MRWARPRCITRKAVRHWTARACRQAWRSSTRWSWRGRRCSDTARRRDEGTSRAFPPSEELLSSHICDNFWKLNGASGSSSPFKLEHFQSSSDLVLSNVDALSHVWDIFRRSRFLWDCFLSSSSLILRRSTAKGTTAVQYKLSLTHSLHYWRIFCITTHRNL